MTRWFVALLAVFVASAAMAKPATVDDYMGQPQVKADARIAYGPAPAQVVRFLSLRLVMGQ